MSIELQDALSNVRRFRPVAWEQIPDLGLYMDQVITFISRACQPLYGQDARGCISAPMINNYVKGKLIPRPAGKKYSREQIALLSMIVTLKQVSSMEDIRRMLELREGETVEALYTAFCDRFTQAVQAIRAPETGDANGPLRASLDLAIMASAYRAGCGAALAAQEPTEV